MTTETNSAERAMASAAADQGPPPIQIAGHAPDGVPISVCGVDTDVLNRTGLVYCGQCKALASFKEHGARCYTCQHYCGLEVPTTAVHQMLDHNAKMRDIMAEQEKRQGNPDLTA